MTELDPFPSSGRTVAIDALDDAPMPEDETPLEPWPDPVPLTRAEGLGPFPVDALPGWAADFVHALSVSTQTPAEMAATCVLGAISSLTGGRVWIEVNADQIEGTNLYLAIVAEPGTRKSPVHAASLEPVREHERLVREEERPRVARAQAERGLLEQRIDHAKREIPRLKGPAREQAERDLLDATEDLERTPVPTAYRLIAGDVTPERLIELLSEQRGRLALLSDEDTVLGHLLGRYSKQPPIEAFLSAYSNKAIDRDRKGAPWIHVERPALTIVTCLQPGLLRHARRDALIVGRGLLDRFALVLPPNLVGRRDVDPPRMPAHVRERYRESLLTIGAALRNANHTVRFSREAHAAFTRWLRELEKRSGPAGDLSAVMGWAAKAGGLTARIAALLHVASGHIVEPVPADTVGAAVRIVRTLAEHALAAADEMGLDGQIADARALLAWAVEHDAPIVVRDVQREMRARFKDAGQVRRALELLKAHHLVRRQERRTPGRSAEEWTLSPKAGGLLSASVPRSEMRSGESLSPSFTTSRPTAPLSQDRRTEGDRRGAA